MNSTLMLRSLLRFLVLALAALLLVWTAGCGGGGSDPEPPPPAPTEVAAGQRAQSAVGAAGGAVLLTALEGARFTLSVPAGAVPEGTVLALETATPAAGRRLHLRLSPAGLVPAAPLELTVSLPASMALPAGAALVYDRVPVPFTRLADGTLRLRLAALAGGTAGAAGDGRAYALSARALAGSLLPACTGAPVLDTTPDGDLADTAPIEADVYGQCMLGAVNALAVSGQFAEAVRLASSIGAYLQSIGAANTDGLSTRFLNEARTLACTAYGQALDDAAATTVTSFATLTRAVKPVLFWEAAVQRLGAVCPGIPATRYVDVVQNLTSDALRFYAGRKGAVVDVGSVEYTEAVAEVRAGPQVAAQLRSVEAPAPVQALARAQVQERAQPAIVDAVLQAPWLRCRDAGQYDRLIELMEQAGSPAGVKTAAQYCGTLLQAQAKNTSGVVTATLTPSLGGESAGSQRTIGSLVVATDGRLSLSGPIRALGCPAGRSGGSESLEIRFNGQLVRTLSTAPYLDSALELGIAELLDAAGIRAADFRSGTLTLLRSGSPCEGAWGEAPAPLLTLELSGGVCVPPAGQDHCVTVLADLDDPRRAFQYAYAISDQGAHVVAAGFSRADGGPGIALWHRSGVVELPEGFWPWWGTQGSPLAVADDGTVAGAEVNNNTSGSLISFTPAVFSRTGARVTRLLASAVLAQESLPQPNWSWFSVRREMTTMTISPQGRVHFTILETGDPWADSDLGYCGQVRLTSGTGWDCDRHTLYEQVGSGTASARQTRHSPNTGDVQFPLFDGGSGVGLLGYTDRLVELPSFLGGAGAYRLGQEPRAMRDLAPLASGATGQVLAGDRSGRVLVQRGPILLEPASSAVPAGWRLGALGTNGHLQVCDAESTTTRLIDLADDRTRMTVTRGRTITHQGRSVEVYSDCLAGRRAVDGLGRMLGEGWVEAASQTVPLIFTPAGVALP